MTYRLPALSNATSCVVCHVYLSGSCGQLCCASYLYSPSPKMTGDLVFFAVRMAGVAITAAAPAAAFKNSRRRIVAISHASLAFTNDLTQSETWVARPEPRRWAWLLVIPMCHTLRPSPRGV